MAVEVILPRVDMDMQSGRIGRWLANNGDTIHSGDPLFEIETSKAAMEIEATGTGILHIISPSDGRDMPVGSTIAYLLSAGEAPPSHAVSPSSMVPPASACPSPVTPSACQASPITAAPLSDKPNNKEGLLRATPLARRIARRQNIDLAALCGSGPRGRITSRDMPQQALDSSAIAAPKASSSQNSTTRQQRTGLSIRRAGGSIGVPVVFVHGFASEALAWGGLISAVSFRTGTHCPPLLAIDLPGHGDSADEGEASIEALTEIIIATLRAEGIHTVHLVGHSLGGAVCARIARDGRLTTMSLVMLAPAGLGADVNAPILEGILRARAPESLRPWAEQLFADPDRADSGLLRATLERVGSPARQAFRQQLAQACFPDGTQSARLRWPVQPMTIPTRIIWGRQDKIIPWRHALAASGKFALHLLDGCGHMPQVEATDLVADLLVETLSITVS